MLLSKAPYLLLILLLWVSRFVEAGEALKFAHMGEADLKISS
jgi:hypothetical protein